jgi:hypothetical protein
VNWEKIGLAALWTRYGELHLDPLSIHDHGEGIRRQTSYKCQLSSNSIVASTKTYSGWLR